MKVVQYPWLVVERRTKHFPHVEEVAILQCRTKREATRLCRQFQRDATFSDDFDTATTVFYKIRRIEL